MPAPILALEFRFPAGTKKTPGKCVGCGCTDERACEEGCAWIDPSRLLCTACVARALDAIDPRGRVEMTDVADDSGDDAYVALVIPTKRPKKPARRRR
jgi:hypothetical protein